MARGRVSEVRVPGREPRVHVNVDFYPVLGRLRDYLLRSRDKRRARALANESYYGQLAREADNALDKPILADRAPVPGLDFTLVKAKCDGIEIPPFALSEPDAAGAAVVNRARQLMFAGLTDLALTELRWGARQHPGNVGALLFVMAGIHAGRENHDAAIGSLRRAFPDYGSRPLSALPPEIWEILFPVRHWETIREQSAKADMEPALILAVIRQESAFNEKARSRANARGLMQILPSTGRILARKAGISHYDTRKLYQAKTNIALGTRFLSSLLRQYGKSELALAAYNAGDSRVDRWMKEWGNLDMAEFIEQIPFSETRGYVKQVLSNRVRYGLLTSSGMPAAR